MKKSGVINKEIASVISDMGHKDWLAIGDAGMPIPSQIQKIDVSVTKNLPRFIEVLDNVLTELEVQKIYLAEEMKEYNLETYDAIHKRFAKEVEIKFVPHEELKIQLNDSKAFIRTGEMTPYANIILESGVTF
jgi:D-ribose pyranase